MKFDKRYALRTAIGIPILAVLWVHVAQEDSFIEVVEFMLAFLGIRTFAFAVQEVILPEENS